MAGDAASCAYGLARNDAFVENKRVAFLAVGAFLAVNGCRLAAGSGLK